MKFWKKLLGVLAIGICAACCTLPIIGVIAGTGSLILLSSYLEWIGLGLLLAALALWAVSFVKSKKQTSCDVDCECKPHKDSLAR
jgi:hypothetical protein